MKLGTKSLLFGIHNIVIHPIVVCIAWHRIFNKHPNWKELVCIIIHDWGYWGCATMDGDDGNLHPCWAAGVVRKWWGPRYWELCLYHSRHIAHQDYVTPSKLCYADKLSFCIMPWWLYVMLGLLTGEIYEYREQTERIGVTSVSLTWRQWFDEVSISMKKLSSDPYSAPLLHHNYKPGKRKFNK